MHAGRLAPRYERMALLYPRSADLQSYLSEFFIVIVRLCHKVFKFTQKRALGQLISTLTDSDMQSYESELERWACSIRDEVSLLNIEEQRSSFKNLLRLSKSEASCRGIEARCRILDYCSTYDYQTSWKRTRKKGNVSLLQNNAKYDSWRNGRGSCSLFWFGKLGSGKSVLLANVVDDLNIHVQDTGKKWPVAYFFCRHDISESLLCSVIIGSLTRQILRSISDLSKVEEVPESKTFQPEPSTLVNLLSHALPPKFEAYFVLDGLDECDYSQGESVIHYIGQLQERFSLRICASFRSETAVAARFGVDTLVRGLDTLFIPNENPDIEDFVNTELERRMNSRQLILGDPTLIVEIHDSLLKGSQGMFLWVALQIESLCTAKTDESIRQLLSTLPKHLPETFSRILCSSATLGERYQKLTLQLLTAANRPFTTGELQEALSVVPGNTDWDAARQLNDVHSALATCGCLVAVDEEDLTVGLIHHSVKQFIFDAYKTSTGIRLTEEGAAKTIAYIITTYLNYGIFDSEVARATAPKTESEITPSRIIQSTGIPSTARELALYLLRSKKSPKFDLAKALERAQKDFVVLATHKHPFLAYAKSHWVDHIHFISEQEREHYRLLLRLLERSIIDINARGYQGRTLLHWAAKKGLIAVLKTLIGRGANLDMVDDDDVTALELAIDSQNTDAARLLIETGGPLHEFGLYMALTNAAKMGNAEIIHLIIEKAHGLSQVEFWHALRLAAENNHEAVVKLLTQDHAASLGELRMDAVFLAATNGHNSVVQLLLGYDARRNGCAGQEALFEAARRNLDTAAELLIRNGVEATSRDSFDSTALVVAARRGSHLVVKTLLKERASFEDPDAYRAMGLAVSGRHEAVLREFLSGGINLGGNFGNLALENAIKEGWEPIARLLCEEGAITKSFRLEAAFRWAADNGFEEIARLLLHKGYMTRHSIQEGLRQAALNERFEIAKLLVDKGAKLDDLDEKQRSWYEQEL